MTTFILLTFPGKAFCEYERVPEANVTSFPAAVCEVLLHKLIPWYNRTEIPNEELAKAAINIWISDQSDESNYNLVENCHFSATFIYVSSSFLIYFIWILVTILTLKELIQIIDTPRAYASTLDNLLAWPIIFFTFVITVSEYLYEERSPWEHHVAACVILISWIELLLLVGRFPLFGLYVQMFSQVTRNFGKFLFAYICLINSFSLSFGILFHNHAQFRGYLLRLLKTLVMMTGELEYDDFFFSKNDDILYPWTSQIIFAMFLVFGTIILMNLLVGLAVSDIQGLQKSAGLDRLVRQTELIASLENIIFSRWLSFIMPSSLLRMIRKPSTATAVFIRWRVNNSS